MKQHVLIGVSGSRFWLLWIFAKINTGFDGQLCAFSLRCFMGQSDVSEVELVVWTVALWCSVEMARLQSLLQLRCHLQLTRKGAQIFHLIHLLQDGWWVLGCIDGKTCLFFDPQKRIDAYNTWHKTNWISQIKISQISIYIAATSGNMPQVILFLVAKPRETRVKIANIPRTWSAHFVKPCET